MFVQDRITTNSKALNIYFVCYCLILASEKSMLQGHSEIVQCCNMNSVALTTKDSSEPTE